LQQFSSDFDFEIVSSKAKYGFFDGPKAAEIADKYEIAYGNPSLKPGLDSAHEKVLSVTYSPSDMSSDSDIQTAISAIGKRIPKNAMQDGKLSPGERGPEIMKLQQDLVRIGSVDSEGKLLVPDDSYGPRTKQAVENFQRSVGLPVTGVADADTLRSIQSIVDPLHGYREMTDRLGALSKAAVGDHDRDSKMIDGVPDYLLPNRVASRSHAVHPHRENVADDRPAFADGKFNLGDDGVGVQALQLRLREMEYVGRNGKPVVADSDFGANTQFAVREFQQAHGLAPTGQVDLATLRQIETAFAQGHHRAPAALDVTGAIAKGENEPVPHRAATAPPIHSDAPPTQAVAAQTTQIEPPREVARSVDVLDVPPSRALTQETADLHASLPQLQFAENVPSATYRATSDIATPAPAAAVGEHHALPESGARSPSLSSPGSGRENQDDDQAPAREAKPPAKEADAPASAPMMEPPLRAIDLLESKERDKYEQSFTQAKRLDLPPGETENLAMAMTYKSTANRTMKQIDDMIVTRGNADDGGDRVHFMFKPNGNRDPIFNDYVDLNTAKATPAIDSAQQTHVMAQTIAQTLAQETATQTQSTGPTMKIGGLTVAMSNGDGGGAGGTAGGGNGGGASGGA
jgi:peptidoglycan hydrolase-like protein with peptidoglycan-binding domain